MAQGNFDEVLKALSAEYREGLPGRFAELDRLWGEFLGNSQPDNSGERRAELLAELRRQLHSIVGSARTFGLPALTEAARAAEALIDSWREPGGLPAPDRREAFEHLIDALKRSTRQS